MADEESADDLVMAFLEKGLVGLFENEDVRQACEATAKDYGCFAPTHKILVWALTQLVGYGQGLVSERAKGWLITLARRSGAVCTVLRTLISIEAECSDKANLRDVMIRRLRGEHVEAPEADRDSSDEALHYLIDEQRFATLSNDVQAMLGDLASDFRAQFAALYQPVLNDMKLRRTAAKQALSKDAVIASLVYAAEVDQFVGRDDDLDFLHRFLSTPDRIGHANRFQWQLIDGEAGDGKSRLALTFRDQAAARGWHAGFLDRAELAKIDPKRWRPTQRSVMIVDYPAESPDLVAALIANCAENAASFDVPVRLLLLERAASGQWFDALVPSDSRQAVVELARFAEPQRLAPIGRDDLVRLMAARIEEAGQTPPDDLYDQLCALDDRIRELPGGSLVAAPRPLFAAALAEFLSDPGAQSGLSDAEDRRAAILAKLIARDKLHFWGAPDATAHEDTRAAFDAHLNLLALSTMLLGVDRRLLNAPPDPVAALLPRKHQAPRFDADRFARMTGRHIDARLPPLEPDLLGEYFVLDRLRSLKGDGDHQLLIDHALAVGGDAAGVFLIRTAIDFPRAWQSLGMLAPSEDASPAARLIFARAQVDIVALLGERGAAALAAALHRHVAVMAAAHPGEPELRLEAAKGAVNLLNDLRTSDMDGARELLNWLRDTAAAHPAEPELRLLAAKGAFNLLNDLRPSDMDGARALLDWLRDTAAAHPAEPELRLEAVKGASNLLVDLCNSEDLQGAAELFAWLLEMADAYPDEPKLRLGAVRGAFTFLSYLGSRGKFDAARQFFVGLRVTADAHPNEPELRLVTAMGAGVLCSCYAQLGDREAAIEWRRDFIALASEFADDAIIVMLQGVIAAVLDE